MVALILTDAYTRCPPGEDFSHLVADTGLLPVPLHITFTKTGEVGTHQIKKENWSRS